MKKPFGIIVCVLGISICLFWAYQKGRSSVLIEEFKVYRSNLTMVGNEALPVELREFLKARYYFLGNRIPSSWLPNQNADFGASVTNMIGNLSRGKEAMSPGMEYENFVEALSK